MRLRLLAHPRKHCQGIINHIPQRHGIMNRGLILNAQQYIRRFAKPISLEHIPLSDKLNLVADITNRSVKQPIRRFQLVCLNDMLAIVQPGIKKIRKDIRPAHEIVQNAIYINFGVHASSCHESSVPLPTRA